MEQEEKEGDPEGACALMQRAVQLHPADMDCSAYYAELLQATGRRDAAERQFEAAVLLDPSNLKLLIKYAAFLERQASCHAKALAHSSPPFQASFLCLALSQASFAVTARRALHMTRQTSDKTDTGTT